MLTHRHLGNAWLLAVVVAISPLDAQEVEPTTPAAEARAVERDAVEPAVSSSAAFTGTVRRSDTQVGQGSAIDRLDLDRTEITGNQELPKVLYIVPWQKSDPGDLLGRPVNSLLDEVLAPLDREEFIRQVDYYSDLHEVAGKEE